MRRRDFIKFVAGSAAAWPLVAHAEQQTMPVMDSLTCDHLTQPCNNSTAFRRGLKNPVMSKVKMLRLSIAGPRMKSAGCLELAADLVGRKVNVIPTSVTRPF